MSEQNIDTSFEFTIETNVDLTNIDMLVDRLGKARTSLTNLKDEAKGTVGEFASVNQIDNALTMINETIGSARELDRRRTELSSRRDSMSDQNIAGMEAKIANLENLVGRSTDSIMRIGNLVTGKNNALSTSHIKDMLSTLDENEAASLKKYETELIGAVTQIVGRRNQISKQIGERGVTSVAKDIISIAYGRGDDPSMSSLDLSAIIGKNGKGGALSRITSSSSKQAQILSAYMAATVNAERTKEFKNTVAGIRQPVLIKDTDEYSSIEQLLKNNASAFAGAYEGKGFSQSMIDAAIKRAGVKKNTKLGADTYTKLVNEISSSIGSQGNSALLSAMLSSGFASRSSNGAISLNKDLTVNDVATKLMPAMWTDYIKRVGGIKKDSLDVDDRVVSVYDYESALNEFNKDVPDKDKLRNKLLSRTNSNGGAGSSFAGLSFLSGLLDDIKNDSGKEATDANRVVEHAAKIAKDIYKIRSYAPFRGKGIDTETTINESQVTRLLGHGHKDNYSFLDDIMELSTEGMTAKDSQKYMDILDQLEKEGWSRITFHGTGENNVTRFIKTEAKERIEKSFEPLKKRWEEKYGNGQLMGSVFENFISSQMLGVDSQKIFKNFDAMNKGWTDTVDYAGIGEANAKLMAEDPTGEKLMKAAMKRVGTITPRLAIVSMKNLAKEAKANDVDFEYSNGLGYLSDAFAPAGMQARGAMGIKGSFMSSGFSDMFDMLTRGLGLKAEQDKTGEYVNAPTVGGGNIKIRKGRYQGLVDESMIKNGAAWYSAKNMEKASEELSEFLAYTGLSYGADYGDDSDATRLGTQMSRMIKWSKPVSDKYASEVEERIRAVQTLAGAKKYIFTDPKNDPLAAKLWSDEGEEYFAQDVRGEVRMRQQRYVDSLREAVAHNDFLSLSPSDGSMFADSRIENKRLITNPLMGLLASGAMTKRGATSAEDVQQATNDALAKVVEAYKSMSEGVVGDGFKDLQNEADIFSKAYETLKGTMDKAGIKNLTPEEAMGIISLQGFGTKGSGRFLDKGYVDLANKDFAFNAFSRSPTGLGQVLARVNYAPIVEGVLKDLKLTDAAKEGVMLSYGDMEWLQGADMDADSVKLITDAKYLLGKNKEGKSDPEYIKKLINGELDSLRSDTRNSTVVDDIAKTYAEIEDMFSGTSILKKIKEAVDAQVKKSNALVRYDKNGNAVPLTAEEIATYNPKSKEAFAQGTIQAIETTQKMGLGSAIAARLSSVGDVGAMQKALAEIGLQGNSLYDAATTNQKRAVVLSLNSDQMQALSLGAEYSKSLKLFSSLTGAQKNEEIEALNAGEDKHFAFINTPGSHRPEFVSLDGMMAKKSNGGFAIDQTNLRSFGNAADVQSAISLANIPITAGTKTSLDLYKKVLLDEAQYQKDESGNYIFGEDGMLKYVETQKDKDGKWSGTHAIGFGITDALAARGFDTSKMKDLQIALRTFQAEEGLIRGGLTMNEKEGLIDLTGAARESAGRIALEMFADYFGTDTNGANQFAGSANSRILTGIGVLDQNGPMSYESLVNKLFTMVGGRQGELATGTRQIKIGGQDLNITSGGDIGTFLAALAKQNNGVFTKADLDLASKAFRLEDNELFEYVGGSLSSDRLRERLGELPEPVKRALDLYKDTLNEAAKANKAEAEATVKATKATEEAAKIEEAAVEEAKHGAPSSAYTHQDDYDIEESEAHAGPIKNDTVEYKGEEAAAFLLNMMKQAPAPTEPPVQAVVPVAAVPAGATPEDALTFSRYKFKESVGGILEDANTLMSGLNKDIFADDDRTNAQKYYYGQNNTVKSILKRYDELAKQAAEDKSLENDPEFLALTDIIRGRDIFAEDGRRLGTTETIYQKLASGNRARLKNKSESTDAALGRKSLRDAGLDNMFKSYDDVDNIIKEQEAEINQYKAQVKERREEVFKNADRVARDGHTFSKEELAENVDRQYNTKYAQVEYYIGADGQRHSKVINASEADDKVIKESEAKLEEFKKRRDEIQKELRLSIKETINHSINDLSRMSGIITQEDDTKDTVEQQLIAFKKKLVGLRESFDKEKLKALGMSDEDIAALESRIKANEEALDNGTVANRIKTVVETNKEYKARKAVSDATKAQFAADDMLRALNGGAATPEEIAKNARIAMEERMLNMSNDYLTKALNDPVNAKLYNDLAEKLNPYSEGNKASLTNYEKQKFEEQQKRNEISEAQKQWDIDRLGRSYGQNDLQLARLNRTGFRAGNDIISRGVESSFNLRDQYNYIVNAYQSEQAEIKAKQSSLDPTKDKALYDAYEQRLTAVKQKQDQAAKSAEFYGSTLGKVAGVAASVSASLDQLINRLARQMFQRAIAEAKKFVQEYDAVMTEIAMITTNADGEISQSMDDISESIINTGKKLKTGFVDTGKVYAALFRQGLDLSQVEKSAETIMKYSRITGVDATAATKQLTTAVKTGLTGSLQEASDVLVALGDSAATTAGEIAAGMQKAAASAKTVGVSYNELAALITIGTERTQLSGTSIGTSLNTIFQRIQKVTKEGYAAGEGDENATINDVDQALKNAGLEGVRDGESGFKSATEVLTEISAAWNYLTDLQKQSITYAVAGTRQANIFQTLMSAISDESFDGMNLQELIDVGQFSGGITDAKFATGLNSIASGLANIKNIWDEFLASAKAGEAFKNLIDTASTALTGITKVLGALGDWDPDVIITGILGITTAFSGLSAVLKITFGGVEGKITGIMQLASTLLAVVGVGTVYGIGKAERKKEVTPVDTYKESSSKAADVQAEVEKLKYIRDKWKETGKEINKVQYDQAIKSLSALKDVFPELSDVITGATKDLDSFNKAVDEAEAASKRMSDSTVGNLINSTFKLDLNAENDDANAYKYIENHLDEYRKWYNGLNTEDQLYVGFNQILSTNKEFENAWKYAYDTGYYPMPEIKQTKAEARKKNVEDTWNDILALGDATGYKEYIESYKDDYYSIVDGSASNTRAVALAFLRSIGMYNPSQIDMDKWQYEQDVANGRMDYTFTTPEGKVVKFNKLNDSIEDGYYQALKYNDLNPFDYNYYDNLASIFMPNGASLYHDAAADIHDYRFNVSDADKGYIDQWRYLAGIAGNVKSLDDFYAAISGYDSSKTLQSQDWLKLEDTGDWSQMQEYLFGKAGISFRAPSEVISSALSTNLDKYIADSIEAGNINSIYASDTAYDRFLTLAGVSKEDYQKAEDKTLYNEVARSNARRGINASENDIGAYLTDIGNAFLFNTETFVDKMGVKHEIKGALDYSRSGFEVGPNVVRVLKEQFAALDDVIGDEYQAYIDALVEQGYNLEWVIDDAGDITGVSAKFEGVEDNYLDEYISSFTKISRERTISDMDLNEYLQSKSTTLLEGLDEDVMSAIDAYFTALQGYEQTKSISDLNDVYRYQREMENKIAEASSRYYVELGRATERATEWTTALAKTGNNETDRSNLVNWEYSRLNEINSAAMLAGVNVGTMTEQQKRDYIEKLGFDSTGKYGDELTAMAEDVQNIAYQNWELLMKDYRTVLESVGVITAMDIRSFMDSNGLDDTVEEVYGIIDEAFKNLIESYAETFSDAEANQRNRNDFINAIRNGEEIGSNWNDFLAGDTDFAAAYSAFISKRIDEPQLISTLLGFDETNKFLSSSSERSGGLRSLFDLGFAGGLEGLMSGNAALNTDWISENQYGLGDKFVGMLGQLGYDNAESLAGASPEQIKLLAAEVENLLMAEEGLFSSDMMKKRQDYFSTMAKGGTALVKAEAEAVKEVGSLQDAYAAVYKAQQVGSKALGKIKSGEDSEMDNLVEILKTNGIDGARLEEITGTEAAGIAQRYVDALNQDIRSDLEAMGGLFDMEDIEVALPGITISANSAAPTTVGIDEALAVARQTGNDLLYAELQEVKRLQGEIKLDLWTEGDKVKARYGDIILEGSAGSTKARSSGGGGGKSAADKLIEQQKRRFEVLDHRIKMVKFDETMYQNRGELTNYGTMLEYENVEQLRYADELEKAIGEIDNQIKKTTKNSDDWWKLVEQRANYEEKIRETSNAIEENTKKIKENQEAVRQTRIKLEDDLDKEVKARIQRERDMLNSTVDMQDIILDAIKQRYRDEWELIESDISRKKDALEEEKNLISERLNARKEAADTSSKYEEMVNLQTQLALIEMDSTRTREAAELRKKLADIQEELAWDSAEKEAQYLMDGLDQQSAAYDRYLEDGSEKLDAYLNDNNNFSEEVASILSGSQEDVMKWLTNNVKEYAKITDEAQKQMVEGWTDSWKAMLGITDTYWEQIDGVINGGKEAYIEYMKESQDYINASDTDKLSKIYEWEKAYDDYLNARKEGATWFHEDEWMDYGSADTSSYEPITPKQLDEVLHNENKPIPIIVKKGVVADTSDVGDKVALGMPGVNANNKGLFDDHYMVKAYAEGGPVTYTGPAWVDGTMSNPEYMLNADDFRALKNSIALAKTMFTPDVTRVDMSKYSGGQNIGDVNVVINEATISNDQDIAELAERVGEAFTKSISNNGIYTTKYNF